MKRKLYALFILAWALWSLLLVYLFFFVYYTGSLTINSNVDNYRVELYSPGTAQKWIHECPDMICEIYDVSPFDYNVSIIKADYKTKTLSYKVRPRGKENLVVQLEKQVQLDAVIWENIAETAQEKIQRIRDEKLYYAKFIIGDATVRFQEDTGEILLQYLINGEVKDISKFKTVQKEDINVSEIYGSDNIWIRLWNTHYIFDTQYFRIQKLPDIKDLEYIKYDLITQKYIVITSVWAFLYDSRENTLEYQYQFKDYISMPEYMIWVIYANEDQKKKNFNIIQEWNVIIKYSQADKTRKVIYYTNNPLDELYSKWDQVFIMSGDKKLELKNFD